MTSVKRKEGNAPLMLAHLPLDGMDSLVILLDMIAAHVRAAWLQHSNVRECAFKHQTEELKKAPSHAHARGAVNLPELSSR